MKKLLICFFVFLGIQTAAPSDMTGEVFYQIFPRSFYDSNGDGVGDLSGIRQKIPYLKELGVTAVWLNPLFISSYNHKYFADDFFTIDPEFGTLDDFRKLCEAFHKNGLKIYIDMETQYITSKSELFKKAVVQKDPTYKHMIVFDDADPTQLARLYFTTPGNNSRAENGERLQLAMLNLLDPGMLEYQKKIYQFWLDPNGDGALSDGVDGYRMDHVMDNLDNNPHLKGLMKNFWKPVVDAARAKNPNCFFFAEPADWGYGQDITKDADMDGVFLLPLRSQLVAYDKLNFAKVSDELFIRQYPGRVPAGKYQFVVIENHDTSRFASIIPDKKLLSAGAVLTLTLKGLPTLYYGQELGVEGRRDAGNRDYFEWTKALTPGTAGGKRVMTRGTSQRDNDGVSYEEESADPDSTFRLYQKLIALYKSEPALKSGTIAPVTNSNGETLAYSRSAGENSAVFITVINFSPKKQRTVLDLTATGLTGTFTAKEILTDADYKAVKADKKYTLTLSPYQTVLLRLDHAVGQ